MPSLKKEYQKKLKLGDLCRIRRGASPRPIHDYIRNEPGVPWVKIADATADDSRFLRKTKEYIKEEGKARSVAVTKGTLILSNSATPGIPKIMAIDACVHDGWLILDQLDKNVSQDWLYYFLLQRRKESASAATGSVFNNLRTDTVRNFNVQLPVLKSQHQIAKILGDLDRKIELNRKMNETLEQMGQALFKHYFIDNPKVKEWEKIKLSEIVTYISRGISPKYSDDGQSVVINQRCIRNGQLSLSNARKQVRTVPKEKILRNGDILINSTGVGTLGRVAQVMEELNLITADSHVTIVRSKEDINVHFFGMLLLGMESLFTGMGRGTTGQTELSRNSISDLLIKMPPKGDIDSFGELVMPLRQEMNVYQREIRVLMQIRDSLLPRLMSGKIEV